MVGKHAGSWIHPRVAHLAAKCSVKFSVQTNGLIYRYLGGDVTSEESQQVAANLSQTSEPVLCREIVVHDPTTVKDITRYKSDMDTVVVPLHTDLQRATFYALSYAVYHATL
jgi:hypothetical protein